MLYVLKKEQIEHARLRALAQAIVSKDKGKEVFDEYMQVAFPWLEATKRRAHEESIRVLNEEVRRGSLGIRPLWQAPRLRSRLKTKVIERQQAVDAKKGEKMNALYAKLGKIVPV